MSRPKKDIDHQRQHRLVSVRVTAEELERFTARVRMAGLSPTEYLRKAALNGRVNVPRTAKADPALIAAINRIGVNLNQMTRTANGTGRVPPELSQLCGKIDAIVTKAVESEGA
jgi:Bacterial mobilisation protein (MobC)